MKKVKKVTAIKNKFLFTALSIQAMLLFCPLCVNASSGGKLGETKLVKGAVLLIKDATNVALVLEGSLIVFLVIKEGMKYQSCEPEEKSKHKKNIFTIFVIGIIIMCATGLIPVILSYFN